MQMLQSFKEIDSTEEAEIILISDGQTGGDMEAATADLKAAGVVVHSTAVTEYADQRLVDISRATGGRYFSYTESGGSASLAAILNEIISGGSASNSAVATVSVYYFKGLFDKCKCIFLLNGLDFHYYPSKYEM